MTTTTLYAGYDHPDVASLTISGTTYRCYVFIDRPRRTIEARCFVVQDDGAEVQLFRQTAYTVTSDFGPDDPKIIAHGDTFVVHFLEGGLSLGSPTSPVIRKLTLDMGSYDSTPTWSDRGTLTVERFMHDLQPVRGSTDYIAAYLESGDTARARRQNGTAWGDQVWDRPVSDGNAVALRCIAIYADEDLGRGGLVYERTGGAAGQIDVNAFDTADAGNNTSFQVLAGVATDLYLWQAGFCRYDDSGETVLYAEVSDQAFTSYSIPGCFGQRVDIDGPGTVGNVQGAWHLRLLGAPFSYAGARETDQEPNAYALVGYQAATPEDEFGQRNAYVVNLHAQDWGSTALTVRPRIASVHNIGDFDTRLSGYTPDGGGVSGFATGRRCGHVSHASGAPTSGMATRTRTWARLGFNKLMKVDVSSGPPFQPVGADISGLRFHIEEPTQLYRDASDPAAPTSCYLGINPYPVGAGREAAMGVVFGGGCVSYYDRQTTTELGFPWYPEILNIADGGGGNVDAGTYLYCVVWEWRDSLGQLHRSAPSLPVSFANLAANRAITITVGTLTLSAKDNRHLFSYANRINAVLYRTEPGGIVFYRVYAQRGASFSPDDTPANDASARTITITDSVDGSGLTDHETLPFVQLDGGVWQPLPPYQPPAACAIAKWQNRIWLASSQDSRLLYYSQEILPERGGLRSQPPEFNPSLVVRVDGIGRIIAMQELDTALLVFTSNAVYSLTGGGPDGSGNGASYQLYPILTGVGCIDQRSVVSTPDDGVFFQSLHGLYRVSPGGAVQHVDMGERVIDVIRQGGNLRSGHYLADRAAVIWTLNSAPAGAPQTLLYDLQRQRWSVSNLPEGDLPGGSSGMSAAVGGAVWNGPGLEQLHVVVQQGALMIERPASSATPFADENRAGDVSIPLRVRTRPIQLDGIAGFKRVRRVVAILEKPDASGVRVTFYAYRPSDGDYDGAASSVHAFASPADPRPKFGPSTQKCSACWMDFEELPTVPATENVRVVGFQLEIGVKKGLGRG